MVLSILLRSSFLFSALAFFLGGNSAQALSDAHVENVLSRMIPAFESLAKDDEDTLYWEGKQELNPLWDLIYFHIKNKNTAPTDRNSLEIEKSRVLNRLFAWQNAQGAWPVYAGGPSDFSVTASILLILEEEGMGRSDSRLRRSWNWAERENPSSNKDHGFFEAIDTFYRVFLIALELAPRNLLPPFPPKILGLPAESPMSLVDMGILRSLITSLIVWDFYAPASGKSFRPLSPARLRSKGEKIGSLELDQKVLSAGHDLIHGIASLILPDRWKNFSNWIHEIPSPMNSDFWAQEGLGYMLSRRNESGGWYTTGNTLMNLLTLYRVKNSLNLQRNILRQEADSDPALVNNFNRNIALLQEHIDTAHEQMTYWRTRSLDFAGHHYLPATLPDIWDTALALQNLQKVRALNNPRLTANPTVLHSATENLLSKKQENLNATWNWSSTLPEGSFFNWSFYSKDKFYPDTDCSSATLEVLVEDEKLSPNPERLEILKKGLNWILHMQNRDGGFPAWEKNTKAPRLFELLLPGMPPVRDQSQSDVTARVLKFLVHAFRNPALLSFTEEHYESPQNIVSRACSFLKKKRKTLQSDKGSLKVWEGEWISNYSYGSAEALEALLLAREIDPECIALEEASRYLNWFENVRVQSGWGESPESDFVKNYVSLNSPTALHTSYVLAAFLEYERQFQKAHMRASTHLGSIKSAANVLLSKVDREGFIEEQSFTGIYVKKHVYSDYNLMSFYKSIGVLADYLRLNIRD